jgi:hypothetical protein
VLDTVAKRGKNCEKRAKNGGAKLRLQKLAGGKRGERGEREGWGEIMDVSVCWVSSLGMLGEEERKRINVSVCAHGEQLAVWVCWVKTSGKKDGSREIEREGGVEVR